MSQDHGQGQWQAIWQSRGPKAWALRPLSWLYGTLSWVRHWLYALGVLKVARLPVPVVVVGNVVVGGAGKTPTVLALLKHLRAQGWRPGVVSRGYGRQGTSPLEVHLDTPTQMSGDEPALIRRQSCVPVFVAKQRAEAARALLAAHPEVNVMLCDDGLQHLALGRDLAIAVFDDRGMGNGWLLPAGLLREPWPPRSASPFAPDLVLHQRTQDTAASALPHSTLPAFQAQRSLSPEAFNGKGQRLALKELALRLPTAIAGIARPEAFFSMLRAQGVPLAQTVALPDHADAAAYASVLQAHPGTVLCTEKDAVKLFDALAGEGSGDAARIWAVPLEMHVDSSFFAAVDARLAKFICA
jgi:tetraacyldisaccharide 4'-kinase